MKEAFEKILERLDEELKKSEEKYHRYLDDGNLSCMFDRSDIEEKRVDTIKEMLEIVQEVAEEYNGGWIACSERLPKYGEVVMCSCTNSGITISCITHKGVKPSKSVRFGQHSVIAWQPLPKPFQKGDNNENS